MKRLLLAFFLLALATMLIPSLRERADPHIDRFGTFLGEKLEGPLSPIINPYRRLKSQSAMGQVVRELIRDRNRGIPRPTSDEFREYMQRQVEGEDGLDAWGSPYILVPSQDSVAIVSAGPDLEYQTEDDVTVEVRYGAPSTSRRRR